MTALAAARALIDQHIVAGSPRSITIPEVREVLHGIGDAIEERAENSHVHDSRYYTQSAVDALIAAALVAYYTAAETDDAIQAAIDAVLGAAPGALDTLNELAAALADDPNFAATMTTALAGKLSLAGGTLTGPITLSADPVAPLQPASKQYADALVAAPLDALGALGMQVNGNCEVDQINGGAATTAASGYRVDMWEAGYASAGSAAWSVARSTDAPIGYRNSLAVTMTAAGTIGAGTFAYVRQKIEGLRTARLAWGAAGAYPLAIGFWVKASKTGTYNIAIQNGAASRSYVTTFTISVANTWEWKTVAIPADVAGTWIKDETGAGLVVAWDIGTGATYQTTAGSWAGGNYLSASGGQDIITTNAATFKVTGLLLLAGPISVLPSSLTAYRTQRDSVSELAVCRRYWRPSPGRLLGAASTSTVADFTTEFNPTMRVAPTFQALDSTPDLRVMGSTSSISGTWASVGMSFDSALWQFTRSAGTWTSQDVVALSKANCVGFDARL